MKKIILILIAVLALLGCENSSTAPSFEEPQPITVTDTVYVDRYDTVTTVKMDTLIDTLIRRDTILTRGIDRIDTLVKTITEIDTLVKTITKVDTLEVFVTKVDTIVNTKTDTVLTIAIDTVTTTDTVTITVTDTIIVSNSSSSSVEVVSSSSAESSSSSVIESSSSNELYMTINGHTYSIGTHSQGCLYGSVIEDETEYNSVYSAALYKISTDSVFKKYTGAKLDIGVLCPSKVVMDTIDTWSTSNGIVTHDTVFTPYTYCNTYGGKIQTRNYYSSFNCSQDHSCRVPICQSNGLCNFVANNKELYSIKPLTLCKVD